MLPAPVTLDRSRRQFAKLGLRHASLLGPARFTNRAVLVLSAVACASLLLNLRFYFATPAVRYASAPVPEPRNTAPTAPRPIALDTAGPALEDGVVQRITRPAHARNLTHLVIVPGHAIWKGTEPQMRMSEEEWELASYQRGGMRVNAFFSHIVRGAEIALQDPSSLVVFSGGQTHATSTLTEGESYLRLALLSNVFHQPSFSAHSTSPDDGPPSSSAYGSAAPFPRATTEDFALDSFQNLLFSIARFHEYTGRYPGQITVVGYEMKRERFVDLHRAALRWPKSRFSYIGAGLEPDKHPEAWQGEVANALQPYKADLYGCHALLADKRRARNPFARAHPYGRVLRDEHESDDARALAEARMVRALMAWCPDADRTQVFQGPLPWDGGE